MLFSIVVAQFFQAFAEFETRTVSAALPSLSSDDVLIDSAQLRL